MSEASSTFASLLKALAARVGAECKALYSALAGKLSEADADERYLGINGKAASASQADTATSAVNAVSATVAESATKDGSGNVITETYARKDEVVEATLPEVIDLGGLEVETDTGSDTDSGGNTGGTITGGSQYG